MKRIASFEKVSYKQFKEDVEGFGFEEDKIKYIYDNIALPKRATSESAGYDFYLPFDISIKPNEALVIPTGVRARITSSWVLMIFPKSGLGFKYQLALSNTVGIIDADYYNANNEGHILIKLVNRSINNVTITLAKGKGFAQGIFLEYGITMDDNADGARTGGFGSTDK